MIRTSAQKAAINAKEKSPSLPRLSNIVPLGDNDAPYIEGRILNLDQLQGKFELVEQAGCGRSLRQGGKRQTLRELYRRPVVKLVEHFLK